MYYFRFQLAFFLSLIIVPTCAVDIYSRFRVEQGIGPITRSPGTTGTYGGTCYGIDADLGTLYTEAIDMAQAALTFLDNYATSATVRATVQTYFGIKPASDTATTVSLGHTALFAYAKCRYILLSWVGGNQLPVPSGWFRPADDLCITLV